MSERLLTGAEMKHCDEYTINTLGVPSRRLMERAAEAVVQNIIENKLDISRTTVVCGNGNNGGDGYAAARFLAERARENGIDADVRTYLAGSVSALSEECAYQRDMARLAGIPEEKVLDLDSTSLIIDALFGIGLTRDITGSYKDIIDKINASDAYTAAVDIPSGINADTGAIMGCAVKANLTVTFAALKRGLLLSPGAELAGRLIKADIGIGTEPLEEKNRVFTATSKPPFPLPPRSKWSNKGTYGKVLIIGGAKYMAGAAYLSALGAYRTGAGLVRIFTSEENRTILQTLLPEAVLTCYSESIGADNLKKMLADTVNGSSAIVIGPGLSQSDDAKIMLETALKTAKCPLVIDADALNILSTLEKDVLSIALKNTRTVITPHMGEMSRLTDTDISDLKADPIGHCRSFAAENGIVCAMKDARTAVSDGASVYLNITGNSGLSKGGSGDVLTGIIAALMAQGMSPFTAACTGVYLHGRAGDHAAKGLTEYSLLAHDIANHLPVAIKESE